jgi:PAS domain S-box-containing protein
MRVSGKNRCFEAKRRKMMRSVAIHWLCFHLLILSLAIPSSAKDPPKRVVGGDHPNPLIELLEHAVPTGLNAGVMRQAASENATRVDRVLYINSYDLGYKWSDDIERGLEARLKDTDREIELSVEYLDGRRFPGTARNDLLAEALAAKYAGYRHDIVVVSDNFAFDFAIKYRKQLFPDLPIVFCGYNNFRPEVLNGIGDITGVNEAVDFAETVKLAVRIQPALRNLIFITSTGDDSNRRMSEIAEATLFPELRKDYNVMALKDASMAEIGPRLGTLPADSAVFLVGMTRDLINGRRPTPVENTRMIVAVSPVPVYSFWDFALGTGILGGHIITGRDQGAAAAEMVLRILDGTPADSIPVMMQAPARDMIDFRVMKKFGIKAAALPEGCDFINRPVTLWESYGWYIGAALLAISLESLLIVALVLSLRQRKEAFRMLGMERDQLERRVEERTGELQQANALLKEEIRVRNRTEKVITARLRLLEFAATHTLGELLQTTINEAEALTQSAIGFYHFLEADQKTLSLQNWSTRTRAEFCKAEGIGLHNDLSQAGVWTDCIHQRKPVIHNDYASLAHRQGMPPGHVEIIRELVLPVFRGDRIVAIIGVGNKPHDYTAEDIEAVSFLADLGWEIAERKQAEEALHLSRFCIDKAGIGIYQSDENGTIFSVNEHACNSLGYSRDEFCALTIFDIDPEITPAKMLALKELLDETGCATHYTTHRRKDGSTFPVEITANTLDFRGKRYGISFVKDITERKRMEEELRESESRVRRKLESILDPEGDVAELELADIIDVPAIRALVEDLHRVSGPPISISDIKGKSLVNVGWQELCKKFHRGHPETLKRCIESDTIMTEGGAPGEFKQYRCRNNMWHLVTPIMIGGKHMGNLFMGQFFFEDEALDYGLFRSQARRFGFPEEAYLAALDAVPRYSEAYVNKGKAFALRLIDMFSKLSYANVKLASLLAERDRLTETLHKANMVLENSPVVLFRCKAAPSWPVELVSKNVVQFGYAPEEFLSGEMTYSSIVYPRDLGKMRAETEAYVAEGKDQWVQEYRIVTGEGDIRWIVDEKVCQRSEDGAIAHYEGVIIDVTERRKAEEQLILQQSQLRELNSTLEERVQAEVKKNREKDVMLIQQNRQAALGEILDHIAHQWKHPLATISLTAYLLKTADTLERDSVEETTEGIINQVSHLTQMLNDYRDFYRPDKEKSVFRIGEGIDKALAFITPVLSNESIKREVYADPDLCALGYPKEFAQVILNLVSNARDAFKERSVKDPRIVVKGFAENKMAVVTVADNAGGISETVLGSIFEMNFTTREQSGGTGIGLYMSRNIIERDMGGDLTAANIPDGAQFCIRLPMADASSGPREVAYD